MSTELASVNNSPVAPALSRVQQAEVWLRDYLKDGPRPIPDSYIKHGLCRYNYQNSELPPHGIGKKTIDEAIANIGIIVSRSGPHGGKRWQLPEHVAAQEAIQKAKREERETLAKRVADAITSAFAKLAEYKADIEALWREFEQLGPGESIMGCQTKKQFCEKALRRDYRTVRYMLTGGNPVSKRKGHETVSRPQTPSSEPAPVQHPTQPLPYSAGLNGLQVSASHCNIDLRPHKRKWLKFVEASLGWESSNYSYADVELQLTVQAAQLLGAADVFTISGPIVLTARSLGSPSLVQSAGRSVFTMPVLR